MFRSIIAFSVLISSGLPMTTNGTELTVATFNVSMEAENYLPKGAKPHADILPAVLADGEHPQVRNIAAIIQRVRPDILLLNEFDYVEDPEKGIKAFIRNYLNKPQQGSNAIDYPYFYYNTVNTGQPSPYDLDNDGKATGVGADAWGYGNYPGQYGMVLLSKYPLNTDNIRTFQYFKWKDMPGALRTYKADGSDWYSEAAWQEFRLSSKSHWDIPVTVNGQTIHLLASHPTPPVFDGPENRNGKRNHDEIRFWTDYLTADTSSYIYDDKGTTGGLSNNKSFIILGDQNASVSTGDALTEGIAGLLGHSRVNSAVVPQSAGGAEHSPDMPDAAVHTAAWRMRADYVLPSVKGFTVIDSGVFWPAKADPDYYLVGSRTASSDHRLVWVKLKLNAQ